MRALGISGYLISALLAVLLAPVEAPVLQTLTIASWNIKQFGPAKLGDPVRLARIARVISYFDVVAIQEITHLENGGQPVMDRLKNQLREAHNLEYQGVLGPRVGCPGGRPEQYAVLYNTAKVKHLNKTTYKWSQACRDPFIVWLQTLSEDCRFTFTLVVTHTDPDPGALETDLSALATIFQVVQALDPKDDDVILLGDLNAPPPWIGSLSTIPDLGAVIAAGTSTMVFGGKTNDNILFQLGPTGEDYTGIGDVVDVPSLLGITALAADSLSDHLPIFASFRTCQDADAGETD